MSIKIALHDAATNCERDGAQAVITLKSGVQIYGKLKKSNLDDTQMIETPIGGWITFLVDEVAAVEAKPTGLFRHAS